MVGLCVGHVQGTLLMFVPGHCDPTVNHFDAAVVALDGCVQAVWPIGARGPGL
jgi:hypothetical protein